MCPFADGNFWIGPMFDNPTSDLRLVRSAPFGDLNKVAAASLIFFKSVRVSDEYKNLPAFLVGESMGGLATLLMYFQSEKDLWSGLIFSSPLFVIPESMKPSKNAEYITESRDVESIVVQSEEEIEFVLEALSLLEVLLLSEKKRERAL